MRSPKGRTAARVCILLLLVIAVGAIVVLRSTVDGGNAAPVGDAASNIGGAVTETEEIRHVPEPEPPELPSPSPRPTEPPKPLIPVTVQELSTERLSGSEIRLTWPDTDDALVSAYLVLRKTISAGGASDWEAVASVASDGRASGDGNTYIDVLDSDAVMQFAYRIDVEPLDGERYTGGAGCAAPASNLLICIDPGHYAGAPVLSGENLYGYTEGDFTLRLGLKLKQILKEEYGIDSRMTRETGTIQLGGYTNLVLDDYHVSLRGRYAEGCDFFLSLHTNATEDGANGYPTFSQPVAANKTLVILNQLAADSDTAIRLANAVGERLSEVSYRQGLSASPDFTTARDGADIVSWTKDLNDALNTPGAVCRRIGETGDHYGVLRGAAEVGVPGAIIEHGLHTVVEVRRSAMEGDLADLWAAADASGIASGFGFASISEIAALS